MKLLKLLLGKPLLVLLALIVQVSIILITVLYFNHFFIAFQIVSLILGLLIFLHMLSRYERPEFKLPWTMMILTLPYFGLILYACLAFPHVSRAQRRRSEAFTQAKKANLPPKRYEKTDETELGSQLGLARYVSRFSGTDPHYGNRVRYLSSGEAFHADLLRELAAAEHFIFMEYFIIEPGVMWDSIHRILLEKLAAGVEVRILYDDVGNLGATGCRFYKKLQREGIQCYKFNPIRPVLSGIHNNRDHRKLTVIDGRIAYTGGINVGDKYINQKHTLGHWKDTVLRLEGPAVDEFTCLFLQQFDDCAKHPTDLAAYLHTTDKTFDEGGAVQPFGDGPRPRFTEPVAENAFIQMIAAAQRYVYITTPYLIVDHTFLTVLCTAAARGVDVRIITPHIPDKRLVFNVTRAHYAPLLRAGVRIYEYTPGFIHAKSIVCDDEVAFVGTVNLDYRSLVHHFECGALLYRTPCIADIKNDFEETLSLSCEITPENFRMNKLSALCCSVLSVFFPLL